jgi:hypothetical protein
MNVSAAHRPNIAEPEQAQQLGTQIEGEEIAPSGPTSVLSIFWSKLKAAVSKVMLARFSLYPVFILINILFRVFLLGDMRREWNGWNPNERRVQK